MTEKGMLDFILSQWNKVFPYWEAYSVKFQNKEWGGDLLFQLVNGQYFHQPVMQLTLEQAYHWFVRNKVV